MSAPVPQQDATELLREVQEEEQKALRRGAGGRKRDPSRECFEAAGGKRITCIYCGHNMAANTPAERARQHVMACTGNVPVNVLSAVRSASENAPEVARTPQKNSALAILGVKRKRASKLKVTVPIETMINHAEFDNMVNAMSLHDQEREKVIKKSRDIQKNAKQAIFSLHRGNFDKADEQLRLCETVADQLEGGLTANPDLKHGSYSNSMEEIAKKPSPSLPPLPSLPTPPPPTSFLSPPPPSRTLPRPLLLLLHSLLPPLPLTLTLTLHSPPLLTREKPLLVSPCTLSTRPRQYAEAVIFKTFLMETRLLSHREIKVTRDEYLGGVLDFTGELNRYCIARATVRDIGAVKCCRDLCEGLMAVFLQFDFRNGSLRKKFDSLKYTLKKMENTLYELSLAESGSIGKSQAVDEAEPPAATADNGEDNDMDA